MLPLTSEEHRRPSVRGQNELLASLGPKRNNQKKLIAWGGFGNSPEQECRRNCYRAIIRHFLHADRLTMPGNQAWPKNMHPDRRSAF